MPIGSGTVRSFAQGVLEKTLTSLKGADDVVEAGVDAATAAAQRTITAVDDGLTKLKTMRNSGDEKIVSNAARNTLGNVSLKSFVETIEHIIKNNPTNQKLIKSRENILTENKAAFGLPSVFKTTATIADLKEFFNLAKREATPAATNSASGLWKKGAAVAVVATIIGLGVELDNERKKNKSAQASKKPEPFVPPIRNPQAAQQPPADTHGGVPAWGVPARTGGAAKMTSIPTGRVNFPASSPAPTPNPAAASAA